MNIEPRFVNRAELWEMFRGTGFWTHVVDGIGLGLAGCFFTLQDDLRCWGKFLRR